MAVLTLAAAAVAAQEPSTPAQGLIPDPTDPGMRIALRTPRLTEGRSYRMEVDGIDISAMVEVADAGDGSVELRFQPPARFAAGAHAVRLYSSDGADTAPAGDFDFTVAPPSASRSYALNAHANGSERVADELAASTGGRSLGDGALSQSAAWQRGNLQASAKGDLLWNSAAGNPVDKLELGDFLIGAGAGPVSLAAGHQSVMPSQSYLIDGTQRRGAAAHVGAGERLWNATLDGFALSSRPLQGFRNGFGFSNPRQRIAGGYVGLTPIQKEGGALRLRLGSVRTHTGADDEFNPVDLDNRVHSAAIEGNLGGLTLNTEYALSQFGAVGGALHSGNALRAGLGYSPAPSMWGEQVMSWMASMDWQRIDSSFDSRASYGLPLDSRNLAANAAFSVGRLALQGQWSRMSDNVDALPIGRHGSAASTIALTLMPGSGEAGWLTLYGLPTWSASYSHQRNRQLIPHPDPLLPPSNDRVTDWQAGLRLDYSSWNWGVSHHRRGVHDYSGAGLEQDSADLSLDLASNGWAATEKLMITPRTSLIRSKDLASGIARWYLQSGLNFGWQPGYGLRGVLDASYARSLADDRSTDDYQWLVGPLFGWTLPLKDAATVELTLSGNYARDMSAFGMGETWVTLLGVAVTLPWETKHEASP